MTSQNGKASAFTRISPRGQRTIADEVFHQIKLRILSLALPPLEKISEAEVAVQMGVSRQPVREAFKRLAKLGLLVIRPQSGTTVSLISEKAILEALFIRTSLEVQSSRRACEMIPNAGMDLLADLLDKQSHAVKNQEKARFHALDDAFHREIYVLSDLEFVWDLIQEHKAHMDRVRMISLSPQSQKRALDDHVNILNALRTRDPDQSAAAVTAHLATIHTHIESVKAANHSWFVERSV